MINDLATASQWTHKSTPYLSEKNAMGSDFGFTKIWVGKGKTKAARTQLIALFDNECRIHKLTPVNREDQGAHFTILLADAGTGWLHFDSLGQYVPRSKGWDNYAVHKVLSKLFPLISFSCSDDASYTIQHWKGGNVIGKYTSSFFMNMRLFKDAEEAQKWYPIYDDWQQLLADGITEADFLQALPAPIHETTLPKERKYMPYNYYPVTFAHLFGWEKRLNATCIGFNPEGMPSRGYLSKIEAGDFIEVFEEDAVRVSVHARHYAHPNPGENYSPTWDEDTNKW